MSKAIAADPTPRCVRAKEGMGGCVEIVATVDGRAATQDGHHYGETLARLDPEAAMRLLMSLQRELRKVLAAQKRMADRAVEDAQKRQAEADAVMAGYERLLQDETKGAAAALSVA